jgi:hypothetical protein
MRFAEKLHEGMMTITGKWSDGEIGVFRFAVGYYSRFILALMLSCTLALAWVIIELRREPLAQMTKDERTRHGSNSYQEKASARQAVYAD